MNNLSARLDTVLMFIDRKLVLESLEHLVIQPHLHPTSTLIGRMRRVLWCRTCRRARTLVNLTVFQRVCVTMIKCMCFECAKCAKCAKDVSVLVR